MCNLFEYVDYRIYLRDYYQAAKQASQSFSYRQFAMRAGLSSAGLYPRVVAGERNLTPETTERFARGLGLSDVETEFFRALVGFNQADSAALKQRHYAVMLTMADFVQHHVLEAHQYAYLEHWYHPVLRELAVVVPQPWTATQLAKLVCPPIEPEDAKRGLELLFELGLLAQDAEGRIIQSEAAVRSGTSSMGMAPLARRRFHTQMLERAAESIQRDPVDRRLVLGMTLGISEAGYQALQLEIQAFQQRIATLVHQDKGADRVYRFNTQLFPLSTPVGLSGKAS